jgi:hypothetical protein
VPLIGGRVKTSPESKAPLDTERGESNFVIGMMAGERFAALNEASVGEKTLSPQAGIARGLGVTWIAERSYVPGEKTLNDDVMSGEGGKCTCGDMPGDMLTLKLAEKGNGLGDSGRGDGRLRMDLGDAGIVLRVRGAAPRARRRL